MAKRKNEGLRPLSFRNKLLLNQWLISLFGIDPLAEHKVNGKVVRPFHKLAEPIRDPRLEGLDKDNLHFFYHHATRFCDQVAEVAAQNGTRLTVEDSDFTEAKFASVKDSTSPVKLLIVLIGSKKFVEGWDCWRVSTMGLTGGELPGYPVRRCSTGFYAVDAHLEAKLDQFGVPVALVGAQCLARCFDFAQQQFLPAQQYQVGKAAVQSVLQGKKAQSELNPGFA